MRLFRHRAARGRAGAAFAVAALAAAAAAAAAADGTPGVETVRRGDLRLDPRAAGVVAWSVRVPLHAPLAGRIERLDVREGARVSAGDVLGEVGPPQRTVLRDAARARGEDPARWENVYRAVPIAAPVAGVVTGLAAAVGQPVSAETPLAWIADRPVARLYVEETEIARIAPGTRAALTLDALPGTAVGGTVERIGAQSVPYRNAVAFEVDVAVPDWPDGVRPGMSLAAVFEGPRREGALTVPGTAIFRDGDAPHVYRERPGGGFEPRAVRTGLSDGVDVEILDGLAEGDRVRADALDGAAGAAPESRRSPLIPFTRGP